MRGEKGERESRGKEMREGRHDGNGKVREE